VNPSKSSGIALAAGFMIVVLALFRNPQAGVNVATSGIASILFFLVLPVGGVLVGLYVYADGPYNAMVSFAYGSYLGIVALGLLVSGIGSNAPSGIQLVVGLITLPLSMVAILGSIQHAVSVSGVPLELIGTE
jgi:hypothetical protein